MFFGSYEHVLDEKGRLVIPSKWRKNVEEKLYILKGYEGSLIIYKEEDFENYLNNLKTLPYSLRVNRDVTRIALSSVFELNIDKQYRVQLPASLLTKYSINKELILIGVIDHFEVWDREKWNNYLMDNEKDFEEKAESLLLKQDGNE